MDRLVLPFPPSVNAIWRNVVVRGQPRTLLSSAGRAYRRRARLVAREQGVALRAGRVGITLRVVAPDRRRRDVDNAAKAVLDALEGLAYEDDSQVDELHIYRSDPEKPGRVEVEVFGDPQQTGADL